MMYFRYDELSDAAKIKAIWSVSSRRKEIGEYWFAHASDGLKISLNNIGVEIEEPSLLSTFRSLEKTGDIPTLSGKWNPSKQSDFRDVDGEYFDEARRILCLIKEETAGKVLVKFHVSPRQIGLRILPNYNTDIKPIELQTIDAITGDLCNRLKPALMLVMHGIRRKLRNHFSRDDLNELHQAFFDEDGNLLVTDWELRMTDLAVSDGKLVLAGASDEQATEATLSPPPQSKHLPFKNHRNQWKIT